MGKSSEQFLQMRAEDMALMYDHTFTKKRAEETGLKLVTDLFEKGEVEPIRVYSNIVRLKTVIDSADKAFRERLNISGKESWNGVEITPMNGKERLNYEEDEVCRELSEKLKERQELVKRATKSKDVIYDKDGCEVPKVSSKFDKASITVKF